MNQVYRHIEVQREGQGDGQRSKTSSSLHLKLRKECGSNKPQHHTGLPLILGWRGQRWQALPASALKKALSRARTTTVSTRKQCVGTTDQQATEIRGKGQI